MVRLQGHRTVVAADMEQLPRAWPRTPASRSSAEPYLFQATSYQKASSHLQGHRTVVAADMEELPEGLAEDAAQHRETWTCVIAVSYKPSACGCLNARMQGVAAHSVQGGRLWLACSVTSEWAPLGLAHQCRHWDSFNLWDSSNSTVALPSCRYYPDFTYAWHKGDRRGAMLPLLVYRCWIIRFPCRLLWCCGTLHERLTLQQAERCARAAHLSKHHERRCCLSSSI